MFSDINLTQLSEISTHEKTCLSLYISGPESFKHLEKNISRFRQVLKKSNTKKDEKELFEENINTITEYLQKNPLKSGALCIISCWLLDFFKTYPLTTPVKDLIWFDSSPYIRPLAELKEEYENVAVVIADNKKARIFLITSAVPDHTSTVEGNIKNHVRKGGWSQQRYERRRDKQLHHYSREIVDTLIELEKTEDFNRVLLVGGKEIQQIIYDTLPKHLQKQVSVKPIDLHKTENIIHSEIMELFFEQERQSEQNLWEKIRGEYLRNGLGIVGIGDVLHAVKSGQVEEIIVNRNFQAPGKRCRDCENIEVGLINTCSACGSHSLISVDLVNEIAEMANLTGASVDFCDTIDSLKQAGNIAAFLRYKI